jgi:hypothetical protein
MARITMGRRIEALPGWAHGLFVATVAAVVLAAFFATRGHVAPDGTDCGGVLVPNGFDGAEYTIAGCSEVLSEHEPLALTLAGLAVALVVASAATMVVRGWSRREPARWPGS